MTKLEDIIKELPHADDMVLPNSWRKCCVECVRCQLESYAAAERQIIAELRELAKEVGNSGVIVTAENIGRELDKFCVEGGSSEAVLPNTDRPADVTPRTKSLLERQFRDKLEALRDEMKRCVNAPLPKAKEVSSSGLGALVGCRANISVMLKKLTALLDGR